jgi:hypothetical protein
LDYPHDSFLQIFLDLRRLQKLIAEEPSLNKIFAVFGAASEDVFDLLNNLSIYHEIIAKSRDLSSLDHSLINDIDSRLGLVLEVFDDGFYFWPCYFL